MRINLAKSLLLIFLLIILSFLIIPRYVISASQGVLLPTPNAPEPYPFSGRYPAVIYLHSPDELQTLYDMQIDLGDLAPADGTRPVYGDPFEALIATVYINPAEAAALSETDLTAIPIPNEGLRSFLAYGPGSGAPNAWPTFEQFVTRMQNLADAHPGLVNLVTIGLSVQGRDLLCLEVTDNPDVDESEPEFKYSSTMHGDETTGIEMTLRLAELLVNNYNIDPHLTGLVNEIEIWLCPIHNPDGYVSGDRYNANDEDLNRNFPDRFTNPNDDPAGREPETQAFMYFGYEHNFVMGANYHGGALVLNYPWDAVVPPGDPDVPDYAPDDLLFHDLGYGYTIRNPMIWNGGFFEGLTRGWEWYSIYGGMQDWAYYWHGEHHVTIEVSAIKSPSYDQMDNYWENNREAMLWWMESSLTGVHGLVYDALDGTPLDATITINEMEQPNIILTDPPVGDYHRVIGAGDYSLTASADGYYSQTYTVTVSGSVATIQDFVLLPLGGLPDLSPSSKLVEPAFAASGESAAYQLIIENAGSLTTASITDTLPISLTWNGYLTATQGTPLYLDGEITWQGEITTGQSVTITYGVTVGQCLPAGTAIPNLAQIDDNMGIVLTRTAVLTVTNLVPGLPVLVSPADGSINQPFDLSLDWQGSDPNCDLLTYDVSLGTANPPPLAVAALTETLYLTDSLQPHSIYYWSVTANDGLTHTTSPVWQFTTLNHAPDSPILISPMDGAVEVPTDQALSWQASDPDGDPITYLIAFGNVNPPPVVAEDLTSPQYNPGLLQPAATYYWQIIASDGLTQTSGDTWSFTTSPLRTFIPLVQRSTTPPSSQGGSELLWLGKDQQPGSPVAVVILAFAF